MKKHNLKRTFYIVLTLTLFLNNSITSFAMQSKADKARVTHFQMLATKKNMREVFKSIPEADIEENLSYEVIANNNPNKDTEKQYREDLFYRSYDIPENTGFKSFMGYKKLTCWKQKRVQKIAETNEEGIRTVDGRYCIAVGTKFDAPVGQYIDVILENGEVIECVVGDIKADADTDKDNIFTGKCCSEFIVDTKKIDKEVRYHGDMSYANKKWNSPVCQIKTYDLNVLKQ